MGKEEFKHFFDSGREWACKHIDAGEALKDLRKVAMCDVTRQRASTDAEEAFAAGALYEITLAEFTR